jgi:predicted dehydrogenase
MSPASRLLIDDMQKSATVVDMLNDETTSSVTVSGASRSRALRVGIVGAGFMGRTHAIAARHLGATISGVVASSAARIPAAVDAVGADEGFASLAALLETDVDVVHICLPNRDHFSAALAVLESGRHVVCEKPLAIDLPEAEILASAAARLGRIAAVPFVYRFHPMVRELRARILAGEAGVVGLVHGSYLQDWLARPVHNWRVDAAAAGVSRTFADIGSHWFDLLEFVTGDPVAAVSAQFSTVHDRRTRSDGSIVAVDTEDTVVVQFRTAAGVVGSFAGSQVAAGRKNRLALEVSGTEHSFAFDQEDPERLWIGDESGHRILVRDPQQLAAAAAEYAIVPSGHAQGYQDAFNAFVRDTYRAIQGDRPDGLPDFGAGLRSARIVDAVVRSRDAGSAWIDVDPAQEEVAA